MAVAILTFFTSLLVITIVAYLASRQDYRRQVRERLNPRLTRYVNGD
jgi:hypothetical protein